MGGCDVTSERRRIDAQPGYATRHGAGVGAEGREVVFGYGEVALNGVRIVARRLGTVADSLGCGLERRKQRVPVGRLNVCLLGRNVDNEALGLVRGGQRATLKTPSSAPRLTSAV